MTLEEIEKNLVELRKDLKNGVRSEEILSRQIRAFEIAREKHEAKKRI